MRFVLLVSACVLFAACKARAPSEPQATRSDSAATAASIGKPAQIAPENTAEAEASSPASLSSAPVSTVDLTRERTLIDESEAARKSSDYATARTKAAEAVASLLARPEAEQDEAWLALLESAGQSAWDARDTRAANTAWQRVFDIRLATLPDDHPALQKARQNFAGTIRVLGELAGARVLYEKVLEVRTRTLPDDHPELQAARKNLALTLKEFGDLEGARDLEEKVLEIRTRTLPDDHPELQGTRNNLAGTMREFGDLEGARILQEKVLEIQSRTLPDDHPDLQNARLGLASTLFVLGDLAGARILYEKVLEVRSRTLPDDHPDLQSARQGLAGVLFMQGDLASARVLYGKMLEVYSRTLPDDHPNLQMARWGLAMTIDQQGDSAGARVLFERVLEVYSRTLPDDHPSLQMMRLNLAVTTKELGDLAGARALEETALEIFSRTLPDDHLDLQIARENLARTIASQFARAGRISGVEGENLRERDGDRERCADLIGALCRAQVHAARDAILGSSGREAEERSSKLAKVLDVSLSFTIGFGVFEPLRQLRAESFVLAETTRGAAIVSAGLTRRAADSPQYGELRDALREAGDELAALAQQGTTSEEFDRARSKRESVESELVALARELSGGKQCGLEFDVGSLAARLEERGAAVGFRRFRKWRVDVVDELDATGQPAVRETLVDNLCAFVVRSAKSGAPPDASPPLTLVDLGPIAPIEAAVRAWRDGLGVGSDGRGVGVGAHKNSASDPAEAGSALREQIFDPLLPALAGAQRIVVALDDVLHLVPLDALPFDGSSLLGDRWRIETRATLTELLQTSEPVAESGRLVAFGDVEYGAEADSAETAAAIQLAAADVRPRTADIELRAAEDAGILRGSVWSEGFSALPATGFEVRGIARCFRDRFGADAAPELCEHAGATRTRLMALASQARWLHIATHGWFAPESIRSWNDPEPLDEKSGLATRMSGAEQVKGMSPMLLCGLAFAGANRPENAVGRVPGLVTADELSTLDLSNCELAVLSACDTNVGERRAGLGVASLQKALQMAGARSVITSLWKVPDEATKELMLEFYRHLWVEKKPKHQALWEAKTKLREAKDERGAPKYTTRDWAAWVLTGNPD